MQALSAVIFALIVAWSAPAGAQDYPTKPIRIIVPYAPGGVADIAARVVGQKLTEVWGQQVVVENRPGGNGFIAVTAVTKSAPDGYTLLVGTVGEFTINPALFKDLPYDVQRDLEPIGMINDTPIVLAANANSPFKTVKDVIDAAKAQPGRISVASAGNGTMNHLGIEWMALTSGVKFQHIPYKGGAPAGAAVAAGDVPLGLIAISSAIPQVKAGRTRVIALTTAKRSSFYPDWGTLQENGVPEVDASNWVGMFAPKGTPKPIVDKISAELIKILAMPDVRERYGAGGAEVVPMTSAEFDARIRRDTEKLKGIVQKANVSPN